MRRTRSPCCARAASGHAAAPPSSAMNSRRRIFGPSRSPMKPIAVGASCLAGLAIFFAARETASVQVFRCRHCKTIHALGRPASEKRQGRKSRWVGHRRCRGLYGGLAVGCGAGRYDRSGRTGRIGSKVGCALGRERVNGVLRDTIDAIPGQSGVSTQVGTPPVESRPEWRVSMRWWIGDDGIMRCRS